MSRQGGMNLPHLLGKLSSSARLAKRQPAMNVEEVDATPPAIINARAAEASQQLHHRSNVLLQQQQLLLRPALKLIDNELESRDVDAMKFLCGDSVPAARLEGITRGLQLFEELERDVGSTSGVRSNDYLQLVGECLMAADRLDLLKHLGHTSRSLREVVTVQGPRIPRFRLMLHRIVQELTKAEVDEVKFLLRDYDLSRKKLEEASDAYEVFNVLLQPGLIGESDVGTLILLFQAIKRSDLVDIAQEYQDSIGPSKTACTTDPRLAATALTGADATQSAVTRVSAERHVQPQKSSAAGTTAETPAHSEASVVAALTDRMRILQQEEADFPSYSMQSMPHGICVIINNVHFRHVPEDPESKPGIRERQGSDHDAAQLSKAFMDLGFTVRVYQDLDSAMLLRCMQQIADMDHSQSDSFVCCLLTHGLEGHVYGCDSRLMPIKDLTQPFVARQCRTLSGKPKLFFIQACQGKTKQLGAPPALETDDDSQIQPELSLIPDEADFLVGYATVPGYVSFRSPKLGSWYIRKLCEMLTRYSDRYDLLTMLTKVNDEVSKGDANVQGDQGPPLSRYKQMPAPMSTLRKRLFFRPLEQRLAAVQTRAALVSGSNSCNSSSGNSSRSGKPG